MQLRYQFIIIIINKDWSCSKIRSWHIYSSKYFTVIEAKTCYGWCCWSRRCHMAENESIIFDSSGGDAAALCRCQLMLTHLASRLDGLLFSVIWEHHRVTVCDDSKPKADGQVLRAMTGTRNNVENWLRWAGDQANQPNRVKAKFKFRDKKIESVELNVMKWENKIMAL